MTDPSVIMKVCEANFTVPQELKGFTDVLYASSTDQEKFGNDSGLMPNETKNLYDSSIDGSLASEAKKMEQDLATAFGCKGDGKRPCSMEELSVMQWTSGMIT